MKKVLIITYYWPPSGGGGVQRWLKFSKYLPAFGWQPIIFTPENPDFQIKDASLINDIPEEAEVLRFPIWEPYGMYNKLFGKGKKSQHRQGLVEGNKKTLSGSFAQWVRGNFFVPDPKVFWVGSSVDFLKDFIKGNSIDLLVTTGPPHSMHLIGLKLKKKTGIKWIADFRDPWVRWDMLENFHLSFPAKQAHRRMESAVIKNADRVVSVSESWAQEIKEDHNRNAQVITNGFDKEDFIGSDHFTGKKFIISHCGLINTFRNPAGLWEVLADLCQEKKAFADSLEIHFSGTVDQAILDSIQADPVLGSKFKFLDYLSHNEVVDVYMESSVLLLLLNKTVNSRGHIPGKLFEYMAANRYILAIGDTAGDSSKLIGKTGTGITCDPGDHAAIKNALSSFFTHYKNGIFPDSREIEEFSHRNLTSKLVDLFKEI